MYPTPIAGPRPIRTAVVSFLAALLLVALAPVPAGGETAPAHVGAAEVSTDSLLVRFDRSAEATDILRRHRLTPKRLDPSGFSVVATGGTRDIRRLRKDVAAERGVLAVEHDVIRRGFETPNDTRYGEQTNLGVVRLPLAWDAAKATSEVVIAVVDSGVNATHPDLIAAMRPGGWDFVEGDPLPQDATGHGTAVAGVAGATTDNLVGIAGTGWRPSILPVRVLGADNRAPDSTLAQGIRYAADQGADVINLSLGGYGSSSILASAVAHAIERGSIVVAAAGNLSTSTIFKEPVYPASYRDVIGVGATDDAGAAVSYSLHGPWVDVTAPGHNILTTASDGGYVRSSGTSFAAPMAAGVAALVRQWQQGWTAAQVGARLPATARDAGSPGRDHVYGHGILDAAAAVAAAPVQAPRPAPAGDAFEPNDTTSTAASVAAGVSHSATIAPEGEVDWYRLALPASSRVTVEVIAPPDAGITRRLDPMVRVLDPAGTVIASADANGSGSSETVTFDSAGGGTFLVEIQNFLPSLGSGPYTFGASVTPITATASAPATTTTTTAAPAPAPSPPPTAPAPAPAPAPRSGYWMVGRDGAVYAFGDAGYRGNVPGMGRGMEAVDLEPTPDLSGYWVVTNTGHVYGFGGARHVGALDGALDAGESVTSISGTPSGNGYWLFTTRGRVVGFGDAPFLGDMRGVRLNGPVLDSIPTPTGRGYFMVASDGGIFTFGDATFAGSMGGIPLNAPVQSLVPDRDGSGYWLVASDGGIFSFDAPFRGSMGAVRLNGPVTGMVRFGNGYLMVGTDGGIFNFSDRDFHGSLGDNPPPSPIVSVAAAEG